MLKTFKQIFFVIICSYAFSAYAQVNLSSNQTAELTPVLQNQFPAFDIQIEQASFSLPVGLQTYAFGTYAGQWILIAGRKNGLHNFNNNTNNFPPNAQNDLVFVVNPTTGVVTTRSLTDPASGLTQDQIDSLTVTAPQYYTNGNMLYMTGGYGVNTATGLFSTKSILTAINMPGLMHWVTTPSPGETAAQYIRQISNPCFQVTGGYMDQVGDHPTLLIFGQNFQGFYLDSSNGQYTEQVRRFRIHDDGVNLSAKILPAKPSVLDPNYRRRDLNVVPAVRYKDGGYYLDFLALGGVFTPDTGVWTVPVKITGDGVPSMANPNSKKTFKQAMNHYNCATIGLFSKQTKNMHVLLFGGISYGFIQDGIYQVDAEIPFINQTTTITIDKKHNFKQYLMNNTYPVILSTQSNPGNQLLFGAGARFIHANIPFYSNKVINLDALGTTPTVIGYIVGGIQSTLPDTNDPATDSAASPYIFTVTVTPVKQG